MKFRELLKRYTYYMIIAILVVIALVFMPMFTSAFNMSFDMPNTTLGMVAYIVIRCLVGVIVFLIFVSFDSQGLLNVLDDPNYLEAWNLLHNLEDKDYIPMSPARYKAQTYGFKAVTLSFSMTATAFVMMEMILSYNYIVLITYLISIIMAVIGGIFQMKKSEIYWTEEFLKYAKWKVAKTKKKEEENLCLNTETKNFEI